HVFGVVVAVACGTHERTSLSSVVDEGPPRRVSASDWKDSVRTNMAMRKPSAEAPRSEDQRFLGRTVETRQGSGNRRGRNLKSRTLILVIRYAVGRELQRESL